MKFKLRKIIPILLIVFILCFVGCSSNRTIRKHEGVGTIKSVDSTFRGVAGKGGRRVYVTIIEYNNEQYKIRKKSIYKWAKNKIDEQVDLNIDEYYENDKLIDIKISIDEYKMK